MAQQDHPAAMAEAPLAGVDGAGGPFSRRLQRIIAISSGDPSRAAAAAAWAPHAAATGNPLNGDSKSAAEPLADSSDSDESYSRLPLNTSADLERDFQAAVARMRLAERLSLKPEHRGTGAVPTEDALEGKDGSTASHSDTGASSQGSTEAATRPAEHSKDELFGNIWK